jgi:large subunit ribosomal protein L10
MNRDQKAAVVDEIAGQIEAAQAIFAVDYRGISVAQIAELRAKLSEFDTRFRIVKNSLSERAADKAGADALRPMLEGPTALALVGGDAAMAAKALNETARALNNLIEFKGGLMDGAALTADEVRAIARLPSRDVLNAQLVGTIAAPLSGLVRTLNALIAGLAIQLQSIVDQDLVSGEAPAAAPTEPEAEAAPAEPVVEAGPAPESEAGAAPAEPVAEAAPAEPEAEAVSAEPVADAVSAEPEAGAAPAEPEAEAAAAEPDAEAAPAEPEAEAAPAPEPDQASDETEQPEADAADADASDA